MLRWIPVFTGMTSYKLWEVNVSVESKPRVRLPSSVKAGEVIEIKTLISHEMESGQRKDPAGKTIPRLIIREFTAKFNGKQVFQAEWYPAISANPYQSFFYKAAQSGTFEFVWKSDDGKEYKAVSELKVS